MPIIDPPQSVGGLAYVQFAAWTADVPLVPFYFGHFGVRLFALMQKQTKGFTGRFQVVLDLQGRHAERFAVVEEPVRGERVIGKPQGVIHPQAKQIFHGVLVFVLVQAPDHGFGILALHLSDGLLQVGIDPFRDDFALLGSQRLLVFGRHLSQLDLIRCVVPSLGRRPVVEKINRQVVEAQIAFLFIGTMALHAMGLENRTNFFFKGVRRGLSVYALREESNKQQAERSPNKICFFV